MVATERSAAILDDSLPAAVALIINSVNIRAVGQGCKVPSACVEETSSLGHQNVVHSMSSGAHDRRPTPESVLQVQFSLHRQFALVHEPRNLMIMDLLTNANDGIQTNADSLQAIRGDLDGSYQ